MKKVPLSGGATPTDSYLSSLKIAVGEKFDFHFSIIISGASTDEILRSL